MYLNSFWGFLSLFEDWEGWWLQGTEVFAWRCFVEKGSYNERKTPVPEVLF